MADTIHATDRDAIQAIIRANPGIEESKAAEALVRFRAQQSPPAPQPGLLGRAVGGLNARLQYGQEAVEDLLTQVGGPTAGAVGGFVRSLVSSTSVVDLAAQGA